MGILKIGLLKTMQFNLLVGLVSLGSLLILNSCESFLEVDPPTSKIPSETVFTDDDMATAAIVGIYANLYLTNSFASGSHQSLLTVAGLSADELRNNPQDNLVYLEFQNNNINPSNTNVLLIWNSMYKAIYQANAALEGLSNSSHLTASIKQQLKGEAFLVRGFCYFYLTNIFGDVPIALSTDYTINNKLSRSSGSDVYKQMLTDLSTAEDLLSVEYVGTDRIRPNKSTATALLSRAYLYTGDWARAEDKATNVIENADYSLPNNLSSVFLASSTEAIWQLRPSDNAYYTNEGYYLGIRIGPDYNVLRTDILDAFEDGDKREANWITSTTDGATTVYLPYKYKRYLASGLTDEYSVVIRLAEVYLIRAEARLAQGKRSGAIADVDKIRHRAGLPLIGETNPNISDEGLLTAIEQERRIEFLAEWGHRWLDLKRWNRAIDVLGVIKPALTSNDLLYPVPYTELAKNPNLNPQNPGY